MKRGIKRTIALLCVLSFLLSAVFSFSSCKRGREDDGVINIVCTAFPQYDWIRAIIGDDESFSLEILVDNGSDLHSYQPTVADRVEIAECDLLVSIGGESDAWVAEMLGEAHDARHVKLFDIEGITLREITAEGILSEHVHSEHEGHGEHHHEHGSYDEHVWLSIKNAVVSIEYLKNILIDLAPESAGRLSRSADSYIVSLDSLAGEYESLTKDLEAPRLIFADRFPFAYLTGELGIEFCAAFDSCSTENNADISTVTRLTEKADEWEAEYILVTETSDKRLAKSVIAASASRSAEILVMDSMQSLTRARINDGEDYLSIMRKNLEVLRTVFY